jgi:hypothetical protein
MRSLHTAIIQIILGDCELRHQRTANIAPSECGGNKLSHSIFLEAFINVPLWMNSVSERTPRIFDEAQSALLEVEADKAFRATTSKGASIGDRSPDQVRFWFRCRARSHLSDWLGFCPWKGHALNLHHSSQLHMMNRYIMQLQTLWIGKSSILSG